MHPMILIGDIDRITQDGACPDANCVDRGDEGVTPNVNVVLDYKFWHKPPRGID